MPDETPSVIADRYRLDELIERGPVSEVWRGHDLRADWPVAIKLLSAEADTGLGARARAVAKIVHPNVVTVFDVGDHDGRPYLVMELLTGATLAEQETPLETAAICELMGTVASGLDAAHREGVVHGNLKPQDLRRAGGGTVKIVGFGGVAGDATPYSAPEQLDGGTASAASDLYALGCIAYELLCGQPPFSGPDLATQHLQRSPTWPSQHRGDLPEDLERLVLSLLAKDPGARPASAATVRNAFAAVNRPEETQPQPATVPSEAHRMEPRVGDTAIFDAADEPSPDGNRRVVIQAVAAVLVIVVVTVVLIVLSNNRSKPTAAAPSATPAAVTSSAAPEPTSTPTPTPTPSPTPTKTAESTDDPEFARTPPGGWENWLRQFDSSIMSQERLGGIDPEVAGEARGHIREAGRALVEGKERNAFRQIERAMSNLAKAREKGKMDPEGPLIQFLDGPAGAFAR